MSKEIKILIRPDGTIEMETIGYKGQACEEVLDKLVEQIGGTVDKSNLKSEYWDQTVETDQNINL